MITMRIRAAMFVLGLSVALATSAQAVLITFDFDSSGQSGADLDGLHTGTTTVAGTTVTVMMSATAGTVTGFGNAGDVFNQTGTGFGINAAGTGDDTDALDAGSVAGAESMRFSFTANVAAIFTFVEAEFDRMTGNGGTGEDLGLLDIGSSTFIFDGSESNNIIALFQPFNPGEDLFLTYLDGNGFGLERITLDVTPTGVPEPSTLMLLGIGLVGLGWMGRRRKKLN